MKLYEFRDDLTGKLTTVYQYDLDILADTLVAAFDLNEDSRSVNEALTTLEHGLLHLHPDEAGAVAEELAVLSISLTVENAE